MYTKNNLLIVLFLFLHSIALFSQTTEDFSGNNFSYNLAWQGNTERWFVNPLNQLQTVTSTLSRTVFLITENHLTNNTMWEFWVKMDFDPSLSNQMRVYLMSNQSDLTQPLNGYFIQIGESGTTDGYHLYRQTGTSVTQIFQGKPRIRASNNKLIAKIRIYRDVSGTWEIQTNIDDGVNFVSEGFVNDNTFIESEFMGIWCKYTPTNSGKFYFDDLKIQKFGNDFTAPEILSIVAIDSLHIQLLFSEPMSGDCFNKINYRLQGTKATVASVESFNNTTTLLSLTLDEPIITGQYLLEVNNIHDLSYNIIRNNTTATFTYVKPYVVKKGDIVINEILADPNPQIDLPAVEFVELWNTSTQTLSIKNWFFSDGTTTATFSVDNFLPNQYLILCPQANTLDFLKYGRVIGLSIWPSLNNLGDNLKLLDSNRQLIDEVHYVNQWYDTPDKKEGGCSLERIQAATACIASQNWKSSNNVAGGTPGSINSNFKMVNTGESLKWIDFKQTDSLHLQLKFSRSIDSLNAIKKQCYVFDELDNKIDSIKVISPLFDVVELKFIKSLMYGRYYTLTLNGICDCAQNNIVGDNKKNIFIAHQIQVEDVLINELLFNPKPLGADFIEIYNNTAKIFDIKDLKIANLSEKGEIASIKALSIDTKWILPNQYLAFSVDIDNVMGNYPNAVKSALINIKELPAFPDEKGTVILLYGNSIIDKLDYSEQMHFALLHEKEGVSLERVSCNRKTNEIGNFRSAASVVGFATPGSVNSQAIDKDKMIEDEWIVSTSKTFSPDNDGFEDVAEYRYSLNESGWLCNATVYDLNGNIVRKISKASTISTNGYLYWDGLTENLQKASIGIYVTYFEFYHPDGRKKTNSCPIVLATKLE